MQFSALKIRVANEEQLEKAYSSMDLTASGIVTDTSEEQPLNAHIPIDVTASGMVRLLILLPFKRK